jgi:hypothetical protein
MTPMSGAATGTGIFATGAGEGAANALNSQAQGSMYQAVLPVAQQMVADRKQDYLNDFYSNGAPTDASRIWQGVGNAAGVALAAPGMSKPAIAPTGGSNMTTGAPITPVTSGLAAMASPPPQAAGMRSVAMNQPQMGFMQKAGRMLSGTTSRFAQALRGGSQPRFNYGY